MIPTAFQYERATSLDDALVRLWAADGSAKLLAGGHSLIPLMKLRLSEPARLIDIARLRELRGIREQGGRISIGAATTHHEVATSDLLLAKCPIVAETAATIGDQQVRNRGTIGGSVAHADPGADFPVILTALTAAFVVQSTAGTRTISVDDFFTDFFTTAMSANEILTEIHVPLPGAASGSAYTKLPHPASGYVVVSAGASITRQASGTCTASRIAIGGLGSGPLRAIATEMELQGKPLTPQLITSAAAKAADESDPVDDPYASADYKKYVATVYARKAIEAAAQRAATN